MYMNIYFFIAGILCFVLGLAHSLLGELLIFKDKRKLGKIVPTMGGPGLRERHLRIIWATWHLATFFGWCLGTLLITISFNFSQVPAGHLGTIVIVIAGTMLAGSVLVLVGTRGKHPGWIVLLVICLLLIIGKL